MKIQRLMALVAGLVGMTLMTSVSANQKERKVDAILTISFNDCKHEFIEHYKNVSEETEKKEVMFALIFPIFMASGSYRLVENELLLDLITMLSVETLKCSNKSALTCTSTFDFSRDGVFDEEAVKEDKNKYRDNQTNMKKIFYKKLEDICGNNSSSVSWEITDTP
jgi:hypothetical protein